MIIIRVNGKPAPQGSKRRFPNGGMVESSKAVGPWREAVRAETQRVTFTRPEGQPDRRYRTADGAVRVSVLFLLERPRGHYGTGKNAGSLRISAPARPATVPDIDKLARAVLDGIVAGGAIADDGLISDLHVSKDYCRPGELPGCEIRIEPAPCMAAVRVRFLVDDEEPSMPDQIPGAAL